MKRHPFVGIALCLAIAGVSAYAQTAEPFTGTWKMSLKESRFSQKAQKFELADGTFKCLTCDPPMTVKADGADHPVSGHPAYDTMSERVIDDRALEEIGKKAGKTAYRAKYTVGADSNAVAMEFSNYPPSGGQPVTGTLTLKRVGERIAGMHALSGSWVPEAADISENALVLTFEQTGERLRMHMPTGDQFDAKLDGKPYKYGGNPEQDTVLLKRIGPREIEQTDKLGSKLLATEKLTVSVDGKTLTMVVTDSKGEASTFVFHKQ